MAVPNPYGSITRGENLEVANIIRQQAEAVRSLLAERHPISNRPIYSADSIRDAVTAGDLSLLMPTER